MIVGFLRHAEAEAMAVSDKERRLTPKGLEQAEKVGKFCARIGWVPDCILSSPASRERETTEAVAARLGGIDIVIENFLSCGMSPREFLAEIPAFARFQTVLLVGHQPDFGEVIAELLELPPGALRIRKASLTVIDLPDLRAGTGRLEFFLPVRLM